MHGPFGIFVGVHTWSFLWRGHKNMGFWEGLDLWACNGISRGLELRALGLGFGGEVLGFQVALLAGAVMKARELEASCIVVVMFS